MIARKNSGGLFQPKKIVLNNRQESTLSSYSKYGLKAEDFSGREWFDDFYHDCAFKYLVDKKKCSFDEAFKILDKLNADQAYGILQGLNHEEASGLDRKQIDIYLKYGLSKEDIIGLNRHQVDLVLALKNDRIKSADIREQKWITDDSHGVALLYLMRIKNFSFFDACKYLEDLNAAEAKAIFYGIEKEEVKDLNSHLILVLIERKERDGLQCKADVVGLNKFEIGLVKNLYHFGLTSEIVRNEIKVGESEHSNSLRRLVWNRGILVKDLIPMISELYPSQVYGLVEGLSTDDVRDLNEFQIKALVECRTIKNGLCANDLRNKEWFNSKTHVDALQYALTWGKFTVTEAMTEFEGLTGAQAKKVSEGTPRDNIIGLNEFHLKAIDSSELRWKVTGSHLRGKEWFNSANHVNVLEHLVKNMQFSIEDGIDQLDGLTLQEIKLIKTESIKKDVILKLTPIQKNLIENKYQHGFYSAEKLLAATWLTKQEQAELLIKACSIYTSDEAFALVKKVSEIEDVKAVIAKLKNKEITLKDLEVKFLTPKVEAKENRRDDDNCCTM